jgi:hypothetical protein
VCFLEAKIVRKFDKQVFVIKTRWLNIVIGSLGSGLLEPALVLYIGERMFKLIYHNHVFKPRSLNPFAAGIRFSFGERMPYGVPIWEIKILTPKMAREDPNIIWAF